MSQNPASWTTKNEVDYLTIECGRSLEKPQLSRIQHLERYRDVMDQRVNWGIIDKDVVRSTVNHLILAERGNQ